MHRLFEDNDLQENAQSADAPALSTSSYQSDECGSGFSCYNDDVRLWNFDVNKQIDCCFLRLKTNGNIQMNRNRNWFGLCLVSFLYEWLYNEFGTTCRLCMSIFNLCCRLSIKITFRMKTHQLEFLVTFFDCTKKEILQIQRFAKIAKFLFILLFCVSLKIYSQRRLMSKPKKNYQNERKLHDQCKKMILFQNKTQKPAQIHLRSLFHCEDFILFYSVFFLRENLIAREF